MQIIQGKEFCLKEPCAVAIGKFDGLHKGHKLIIDDLVRSKALGLKSVVFSFEPSPEVYFGRQDNKFVLTEKEKQEILSSWGVDLYVLFPFDEETARMEADSFLKNVLVGQLNMKRLVAGRDLSFGFKGSGNVEFLEKKEREYSYRIQVHPKLCVEDEEISASFLRDAVMFGEIERATFFMGRDYMVSGTVCEGNQIGRTLGFPTCNLIPQADKLLPPDGVYVTITEVDGVRYPSVTNIGFKPTVSANETYCLETHLLDVEVSCYDKEIKVYFCAMLREEIKFESLDKLKKQIAKDKKAAFDFHKLFNTML